MYDNDLPWKIRHNELLVRCLANNLCEYKKFCFSSNKLYKVPTSHQAFQWEGVNVFKFMFFFDHLSVLSTYNNVSVNRLYGFSEFLRPSLNVLQFCFHLDSLQNDWIPYFPFNWVSLIILFVGRCLIYCTSFCVLSCQKLTVQCSPES